MPSIPRHDEILNYLKTFQARHSRMPTRKEIIYHCKIGRRCLVRMINKLEEAGNIKRIPRGILEYEVVE